nr:MAG TPA: hypothetical protein [Bacteriophage sp.]
MSKGKYSQFVMYKLFILYSPLFRGVSDYIIIHFWTLRTRV